MKLNLRTYEFCFNLWLFWTIKTSMTDSRSKVCLRKTRSCRSTSWWKKKSLHIWKCTAQNSRSPNTINIFQILGQSGLAHKERWEGFFLKPSAIRCCWLKPCRKKEASVVKAETRFWKWINVKFNGFFSANLSQRKIRRKEQNRFYFDWKVRLGVWCKWSTW